MPSATHHSLTIGWLYPDLMSTYGDRGNILVLQKRSAWRGIEVKILPIEQTTDNKQLTTIDMIFGGGAQDREQSIVMDDLKGKKGEIIKEKIESGTPALFVCGSPQLMGKYYEPSVGQRIEGLGIFDMRSIHLGENKPRLIGNVVAKVLWENFAYGHPGVATTTIGSQKDSIASPGAVQYLASLQNDMIVGFENHGGRTFLGPDAKPFARVIKGNGNNGEDGTEGVVYKNAIGCYFHGPLLPKNPVVADFLIQRALEVKYKEVISLRSLDDTLEDKAREVIQRRIIS